MRFFSRRLPFTLWLCASSLSVSLLADSAASPAKLLQTAPIRFEPNSGLQPSPVKWIARGQGYAFAFTDRAALLKVGNRSVQLKFDGANRHPAFAGDEAQRTPSIYFYEQKRLSVPAFSRLRESGVYRGIDVVYYGNGGEIEYDFEIAPGANPSQIRLRFDGADSVHLNEHGDLVLALGSGEITQRAPVVYQRLASGEIVQVAGRYRLASDGTARLDVGAYNHGERLIVDPTVLFSAYLAGTGSDIAVAITHDAKGIIYAAGNTTSLDFPGGGTPAQATSGGSTDAWIMQIDPNGGANAILYSSYIGGGADEFLKGMTIDSNGVFYIAGQTASGAFPVTSGAIISTNAANAHGFVSMIDPSQGASGLIYSTYLGGTQTDECDGIAVFNGKIYVTGATDSSDFPVSGNSFQATQAVGFDAFAVIIDPTQSGAASEVAGTYLGGSSEDIGRSIAVDANGLAYIGGLTYSFDFPVTGNGYQQAYHNLGDGFLTVLDLNAGKLIYSSYLGGSSADEVKKILINPAGQIAMTGYTLSSDFPITQNAFQSVFGGVANAFVAVLDLKASQLGVGLTYSTYYGGTGGEVAYDIKTDASGRYYIGGYTMSYDLPVTANAISPSSGMAGVDGFIAVIDPAKGTSGLVYGSYVTSDGFQVVYGLDVDAAGTIYAAGFTTSNIFPNGIGPNNASTGKYSAFVMTFTLP